MPNDNRIRFAPAFLYFAAAGVLFAWLHHFFATSTLIVLLNGGFFGAVFGLAVSLWPLARDISRGRVLEGDVSWWVLGFLIIIVGIIMILVTSAYARASAADVTSFLLSALGRYTITVGMLTIVFAPDTGRPFFYGRDRKVVFASMIVGIAVAAIVAYMQAYEVLA